MANINQSKSKTAPELKPQLSLPAWVDDSGEAIEDPVFILGFSRLFAIGEDLTLSANWKEFDLERFVARAIPAKRVEPYRFSTGSADLVLAPGAGVVLGKAGSGKSLFADTLRKRNIGTDHAVETIRFREPEADAIVSEGTAIRQLAAGLLSNNGLIFVDSLRTTFYSSTGGATGKGGVNMGIFSLLTAFDILARRYGKVILFALNPMTNDNEAMEFYLEAARGAVSHTIYTPGPLNYRLSTRTNNDRDEVARRYSVPKETEFEQKATVREFTDVHDYGRSSDSIADLYTVTTA